MSAHHLVSILLLALLCSTTTAGWLSGRSKTMDLPDGAEADSEVQALLSSMERETALRAQNPNLSVPTHPSCFFRALSSLPSSSPCETLAHSDSLRTEIAVAMALCEISTSEDAKLPRECIDWEAKKGGIGGCVESLSRSPQYWSSYSGNLREIVALCSSFRRWADVELARELHASTAKTFSTFIDQLKRYERSRSDRQATETRSTQASSSGLAKLITKLSSLSDQLSTKQQQQSTELESAQQALHQTADELSALRDQLRLALVQLVTEHVQNLTVAEEGLRAGLALAVNKHELSLRSAAVDLSEQMQASISLLSSSMANFSITLHGLTSTVGETNAVARTTVKVMADVQTAAQLAIASVEEQQAHLSQRLDLNLAQASQLAAVLSNLTDQVRQRQHYEREGLVPWEALGDMFWWVRLFCGFLQEGLGLKGLLISLLVVCFSLWYPALAYATGVLTLVVSLYRFLAFTRSLYRPLRHLPFPLKKRTPTTSSPVALPPRTPLSPFAPPRSFSFAQPSTTEAVPRSSRAGQALSATAAVGKLARSVPVACGPSSRRAPQLYSGESLIIGL